MIINDESINKNKNGFIVGQIWKTEDGFLMRVESIRSDGLAMIAMTHPYKTRAYSQKTIPSGWVELK